MKKIIEIKNLTKQFGNEVVLNDISFDIYENDFVTLLGPSGCGKTTLLRILGGFTDPSSGSVIMDGVDLLSVPANKRNINTVFQSYALFPHLNVYDNVAFGPKNKKMSKNEIDEKAKEALKLVKLNGYEKRSISSLSGGQKQRVAIARAVINRPRILLLDESLSALDLKLRQDMQYELKDLQKKLGITFVFVTHDQEEALTMSNTIVVLNEGVIQQIGTPEEVYNEPVNRFVANFIGETNIFQGKMIDETSIKINDIVLNCTADNFVEGDDVDVVIRPEDFYVAPVENSELCGVVTDITFKGVHYEILIDFNGKEIVVHSLKNPGIGSEIGLVVHPDDIHLMDGVK